MSEYNIYPKIQKGDKPQVCITHKGKKYLFYDITPFHYSLLGAMDRGWQDPEVIKAIEKEGEHNGN